MTSAVFGGGGRGRDGSNTTATTSPEPEDPIKALASLNERIKLDPHLGAKHLMIASQPILFPNENSVKKGLLYSVSILNDQGKAVGSPIWVFSRLSQSAPGSGTRVVRGWQRFGFRLDALRGGPRLCTIWGQSDEYLRGWRLLASRPETGALSSARLNVPLATVLKSRVSP
jgi:hypothetical protein